MVGQKCYACGEWWNKPKTQWYNIKDTPKTQWKNGPPGWLKERMEQALKEQEGDQEEEEQEDEEEEAEGGEPKATPEKLAALATLLQQLAILNFPGMTALQSSLQEAVKALTPAESKEEQEKKLGSVEDKLRDRKHRFETANAYTQTLKEEGGRYV